MSHQVISKQRVADHGEVYTHQREVNAMLDLVEAETQRIDSRFLEPACGNGNFLAEILRRKMSVVSARYARSQLEWERHAIVALASIYGLDILQDNAIACRERLFGIWDDEYSQRFQAKANEMCREAARFLLEKNIVWGDALTFRTVDEQPRPIVLSEWAMVSGSQMKRRDYMFSFLVEKTHQFSLFNDQGEAASISEPVREYPLTHFLEIGQTDRDIA